MSQLIKSNVCIIPARKGSKRVEGKNIRKFSGKPLVSWTIEAALQADIFQEIILSTDSENILAIGQKFGLTTNVLRPKELSGDYAKAEDVIAHHLKNYQDINVCYLQPTSPLRTKDDILASYSMLIDKSLHGVISVCEVPVPINWVYDSKEDFSSFVKGVSTRRSQDYTKPLMLNGAIYWCTSRAFQKYKTHLIPENVAPYIMPRDRSLDIDDEYEFLFAEHLQNRQT